MASYTAQIIGKSSTGLVRDDCVNTLHFNSGVNNSEQDLIDDLVAAFTQRLFVNNSIVGGITRFDGKLYLDSPGPTPPIKMKTGATYGVQTPGPREVALCLSFKGSPTGSGMPTGFNKKWRGRIYIGPLTQTTLDEERPDIGVRNTLLDLGGDIFTAGGDGFVWAVGSENVQVSEAWVDNEWDTQRRRGLRPTSRVTRQY